MYTVLATVFDDDGDYGQSAYRYVVVYNPQGGFVTGGGWIYSPQGSCLLSNYTQQTEGRASFGFVAKYQKGANVPSGETQFQFQAGDLDLHSTTYQWLVIAGSKAQFKGEGTINGRGNYGFLLTAIDRAKQNNPDKFRIKIWDRVSGDSVVYDNQMGMADDGDAASVLQGGGIVIHQDNK